MSRFPGQKNYVYEEEKVVRFPKTGLANLTKTGLANLTDTPYPLSNRTNKRPIYGVDFNGYDLDVFYGIEMWQECGVVIFWAKK